MLSENAIEKLIQPIIDRQENINLYVINKIAQRIKAVGQVLPSDVYALQRLLYTGSDVRKINTELERLTNLQVKDIKQLIKVIAKDAYSDTKPYYDYRNKPFIPFEANIPLQRLINSIATQTTNTYINLSKSQAFMLRDLKNPKILIPTPISQAYQSVVDEAVQAVSSGVIDYRTAMRRTMKQLINSGIVVSTGAENKVQFMTRTGKVHYQRMDTVVRRNLLDGVRAINQGVQDETGNQFNADGKEITVHQYPAPDHAPIQGHQFFNTEFEKIQNGENFTDVNGKKFTGFERAIGTLNCRHFAYSIIVGMAKPNYTQAQLDAIIQNNEAGYTLPNGKKLTLYECTQKQRQLETTIRKYKDGQIVARTSGDDILAMEYQSKINKYTSIYNQFSNACGINAHKEKLTVSGYRKIKVKN